MLQDVRSADEEKIIGGTIVGDKSVCVCVFADFQSKFYFSISPLCIVCGCTVYSVLRCLYVCVLQTSGWVPCSDASCNYTIKRACRSLRAHSTQHTAPLSPGGRTSYEISIAVSLENKTCEETETWRWNKVACVMWLRKKPLNCIGLLTQKKKKNMCKHACNCRNAGRDTNTQTCLTHLHINISRVSTYYHLSQCKIYNYTQFDFLTWQSGGWFWDSDMITTSGTTT